MSFSGNYFDSLADHLDLSLLQTRIVVVVGIGTVGSQMAWELANSGVGCLRLVDGDALEERNLARHVLPRRYVGENKAESMVLYLADEIPGARHEAVAQYVDDTIADRQLDDWLRDADLIVAATDDRETQWRIGRRALALDVPAIFPGLHEREGGEVVVQRSPLLPCFYCRDGFRTAGERLRAVSAIHADTLALTQLATHLSLGILDRGCMYASLLDPRPGDPPPQLFVQNRHALAIRPIPRRPNCPSCAVGPARRPAVAPAIPAASATRAHSPPALTFDWFATRVALLVGALVFLALPFGVMHSVVIGKHPMTMWMNLVSVFCFFWSLAGICAVIAAVSFFFVRE